MRPGIYFFIIVLVDYSVHNSDLGGILAAHCIVIGSDTFEVSNIYN